MVTGKGHVKLILNFEKILPDQYHNWLVHFILMTSSVTVCKK